jgi:hypothetical protein
MYLPTTDEPYAHMLADMMTPASSPGNEIEEVKSLSRREPAAEPKTATVLCYVGRRAAS